MDKSWITDGYHGWESCQENSRKIPGADLQRLAGHSSNSQAQTKDGTCSLRDHRMGVSINGATPKAGCFKGQSIYKWMIIGGTPIYGNYQMLYMSLRPCKTHPTALLKLIQDIPRSGRKLPGCSCCLNWRHCWESGPTDR